MCSHRLRHELLGLWVTSATGPEDAEAGSKEAAAALRSGGGTTFEVSGKDREETQNKRSCRSRSDAPSSCLMG